MRPATICLLVFLLCTPVGAVELVRNISTGYDNATGLVIDGGLTDPDYTIAGPDPQTIPTVLPDVWPIAPGVWVLNDADSKWLGFEAASSSASPGSYDYTTTVSLDGFDPATVVVAGRWTADDGTRDILINGTSTGSPPGGGFNALFPFGPVGAGLFQAGENTITFRIENGGAEPGPTGFRADAGVYSYNGVPESFDLAIYNSGVDDDGVPLPDNAVDPHWTLSGTGAAEGQGPDAIVARGSGGFPIGPWLADFADIGSAWITPSEDTNGPGATDGTAIYEYSTTFTTGIGGAVSITGLQSGDNLVVDVQVDGVSGTFTPAGFNTFGDFSVTADVVGTEHSLSLLVQNGEGEANPFGPTGVRVQITGVEFVPIPEPATWILSALALMGLALCGRRKRAV